MLVERSEVQSLVCKNHTLIIAPQGQFSIEDIKSMLLEITRM